MTTRKDYLILNSDNILNLSYTKNNTYLVYYQDNYFLIEEEIITELTKEYAIIYTLGEDVKEGDIMTFFNISRTALYKIINDMSDFYPF